MRFVELEKHRVWFAKAPPGFKKVYRFMATCDECATFTQRFLVAMTSLSLDYVRQALHSMRRAKVAVVHHYSGKTKRLQHWTLT
jgi:hypothetical protein